MTTFSMSTKQIIYRFEAGKADGNGSMKPLLGGKGAGLAEMANLGIPVPPGFTITTELCTAFYDGGKVMPAGLAGAVAENMAWLEKTLGKKFGDPQNPLLVSVRSGARASMPGMMDTILNLGLNDATAQGLSDRTKNPRFVYDAYRRFLSMYGSVVLGVKSHAFHEALNLARRRMCKELGIEAPADGEALVRAVPDSQLGADQLKLVVEDFKQIIVKATGKAFPDKPVDQLMGAIGAVFESWNNDRAILYRKMHGIPGEWGTAVNVQSMVFGNLGDTSATGVAFTRDPSTGEKRFFGEWLPNAQGEDVVAGIRTPRPISKTATSAGLSLEESLPESFKQLHDIQARLEGHFRDMQDIEFTIEDGRLFMLQTRNGKRAARAEVKIAVDMANEGLVSQDEAVLRVEAGRLEQLLFPSIDPHAAVSPVAHGLAASPGAVTGRVAFSADDAEKRAEQGEPVILVRVETSPEDLHGMQAAKGILTARGGATSHAAVVARGMGRSCVVGCHGISIDYETQKMTVRPDKGEICIVSVGDVITIDGSSGGVYLGDVPKVEPKLSGELEVLMKWADAGRRMRVRANADTPEQAKKARELGAEGIGLCRTEHMFFDDTRIAAVREMILASDVAARQKALAKLLPFQTDDFVGIFREMNGLPVTIRLLDPPLHEFLPQQVTQIEELAKTMGVSPSDLGRKVDELHEFNPMLGHRGVRLTVTYPEICAMQTRAILSAACKVKKAGVNVLPEIMIPLSLSKKELDLMKTVVLEVAAEVFKEHGVEVHYKYGTMIELPRAALLADKLAEVAEFFSFGTNDLTQTTLGLSRDDAGRFLPEYVDRGILAHEPFVSLDVEGVGQLVQMAVDRGKKTRPDLSLGICGEHGGDPESIFFFDDVGLAYVSCSPFRVPIARLAAAQATLRKRVKGEQGRTV
ncbi:MAG: pyruvate, phosphate dikinase [Polyangiaceae bacterium]|nr:pyruvate, phosphate dikinase [Polyangiaceae bacterium]